MKPIRSILDPLFCYVPSVATSVASTWRRAGWRPTTDEERKARRQRSAELVVDCIGVADAGRLRDTAILQMSQVSATTTWHIERRKTQSAGRKMRTTPEAPLRNVMS